MEKACRSPADLEQRAERHEDHEQQHQEQRIKRRAYREHIPLVDIPDSPDQRKEPAKPAFRRIAQDQRKDGAQNRESGLDKRIKREKKPHILQELFYFSDDIRYSIHKRP
jgi:hypothetical protein